MSEMSQEWIVEDPYLDVNIRRRSINMIDGKHSHSPQLP
jgi:hypothetical protein